MSPALSAAHFFLQFLCGAGTCVLNHVVSLRLEVLQGVGTYDCPQGFVSPPY